MRIVKMVTIISGLFIIAFGQTERWVNLYNGPGNGDDWAESIIYGFDQNIYVVGNSFSVNSDFTVVSLTNNGQERWIYNYDGPGEGDDYGYSLVYGHDGNLYAAGSSVGIGTDDDFTIISLTNDGSQRWVFRYNEFEGYTDVAQAIVYGSDGNIYSAGVNGNGNFIVISLDNNGTQRWVYRYGQEGLDFAKAIVYGLDGNLYAAGYSEGNVSTSKFTVISLTNNGNERWVYQYNGLGSYWAEAYSLVYGSDGNIYSAGFSGGNFTVISLNDTGAERWVYRYAGPRTGRNFALSIVYGLDENLYIAGYSWGDSADFTIISLTNNGEERWIYRYNGPGNNLDYALSIVYGSDSNLYTAGYSMGNWTSFDFMLISLNTAGTERWVYRFDGLGNSDVAKSITYGKDGNIYAAGQSMNVDSNYDFIVISLTSGAGIEEKDSPKMNNKFDFSISTFQNQNLAYSLSLPEPANVSLSLYNLAGQKILSWQNNSSKGISQYVKNLLNLSPGVYFLRTEVLGKGYKANKKLIVVK
jgi:uncharacterized delta-60 repeat protein